MKTIIVNIPEKEESFLLAVLKKFHFEARVLFEEEMEDKELAKWIDEGMKSEDVSEEVVFETLRKRGVKI